MSDRFVLHHGDCLDVLKTMEDNSVDSIVTDPPYGLSFMGKKWDYDVPSEDIWRECLRVLKPGGYLLSFAGTRTQHRMAVRIEDAGFEIRDMIAWVYGSGFPKSHSVGKNIEKINVGGIKNLKQISTKKGIKVETGTSGFSYSKEYVAGKSMGGSQISGDIPVYEINNEWGGWGTALKPALEPITVARKPLSEKTVAENVIKHGTGGINIDGCRVPTEIGDEVCNHGRKPTVNGYDPRMSGHQEYGQTSGQEIGRFPANLIHDGSEEVLKIFPNCIGGSAARFFYCAKSSKTDRGDGNNHPTVKPCDLMRYLCKLVTPPNGTVLDPFNGSGSTGKACMYEGFNYIGIERDQDYIDISTKRIGFALNDAGEGEKKRAKKVVLTEPPKPIGFKSKPIKSA